MRKREIAGYPVVDAEEPLILEVKPMDVARGEPQEPAYCAIARAVRRSYDIIEARVHVSRTYLRTREGEWLRYMTPQSARTEMISYDRGGEFEPGQYRFPICPQSMRFDAPKPTGTSHPRKKKRARPYHMTNIRAWSEE